MKRTILNQYTNSEGDVITRSKINASTVVEIDENVNKKLPEGDDVKPVKSVVKISKADRVNKIKELLAKKLSRHEIKDQMYAEQYYFNNPNPASAFAGDWNSLN
jgi:uncharacterized protein YfaS (alpha-2-macroglobulin family)